MRVEIKAMAGAAALVLAAAAQAAVIRVPADQPTIQGAIDAAVNGDEVQVSPGTYLERIDFKGKAIRVRSTNGARSTVIDGGRAGVVVKFFNGETVDAVLEGFTVRGGFESFSGGGGVLVASSSPTIRGNTITDNGACTGAGIYVSFGSPRITGNLIRRNRQEGCSGGTGGGGIALLGAGSAEVTDNTIEDNVVNASDGGGLTLFAAGSPRIVGNIIRNNEASSTGGGIVMFNFNAALIANNLISGNRASTGGGVSALVPSGDTASTFVNNTIADNAAAQGSQFVVSGFAAPMKLLNNVVSAASTAPAVFCDGLFSPLPPQIATSLVFNSAGAAVDGTCAGVLGGSGNLSADPLFNGTGRNRYALQPASPAIDTGDNAAAAGLSSDLAGRRRVADGNGDGVRTVDMGAYELQRR